MQWEGAKGIGLRMPGSAQNLPVPLLDTLGTTHVPMSPMEVAVHVTMLPHPYFPTKN